METPDGLDGSAAIVVGFGHSRVGVLEKGAGQPHFAAGIVSDREHRTVAKEMGVDSDAKLPPCRLGNDRADIGVGYGASCGGDPH